MTATLDSLDAKLDRVIRQLQHVATSLPLSFPVGSPLSPLCAVQGLAGQEVIRDVESRAYPVTPSDAVGIATDASGIHTFSGNGSHIDYGLTRNGQNYTREIITLFQVRPTAFNATEAYPLFSIGALVVSIAPSSGTTAAVRVGAIGTNDTTAKLTLNSWNTIVFSVEQTSNHSYPKMRISVNGAAQQAWNLDSNENFAHITDTTTSFRLGARTSGDTSIGFVGDMRAMFMHPNDAVYSHGGADGWTIPAGIEWDEDLQIYTGASLMDRVEGVLKDVYEPIIDEIAAKSHSLDALAVAPWRVPLADLTSASGSIGKQVAELTKQAILDAFNDDEIANGISRKASDRILLATNAGTAAVNGADTAFSDPGDQSTAETRITITTGSPSGTRTAAALPSPEGG